MGIFKKAKEALRKTREALSRKIDALLSHGELDDEFFDELESILISADVGVNSSIKLVEQLRIDARKNKIRNSNDVKSLLRQHIEEMLTTDEIEIKSPAIITVVGVNGVGKTTSIGKLAKHYLGENKSVMLVAADTFRAAASAQLAEWANRIKCKIVKHEEGSDAAAVVFDGISSAKSKKTDVLLVDTAGRLHTKTNLMEELAKINRTIDKEYPNANKYTFIVLDATTGQNALTQIEHFDKYIKIDGIVLTKLDGTAKGGVVLTAKEKYNLPVCYVGVGEGEDDLEKFNVKAFAENMI